MALDPVCHMEVDEETAQWTSQYQGKTYHFCVPGCKVSFNREPEKHIRQRESHDDHHH